MILWSRGHNYSQEGARLSLSFGGLLLSADYSQQPEKLLETLQLTALERLGMVSLREATRTRSGVVAVGGYQGATLLIDSYLPFDLPMRAGQSTNLDRQVAALSQEGTALAFLLDDSSGTYAFWVYLVGKLARMRLTDPTGVLAEKGRPLAEEDAFQPDDLNDEARILALSRRWLSLPLDELVFFEHVEMQVFRVQRGGA
jgi:hypothetical protein